MLGCCAQVSRTIVTKRSRAQVDSIYYCYYDALEEPPSDAVALAVVAGYYPPFRVIDAHLAMFNRWVMPPESKGDRGMHVNC